jgi:uncharacterized protein (DUF488 family)
MTSPAAFELFTIGHSNHPIEHFLSLVQSAGVTAIADVRSVPFSRRFPWFSAKRLPGHLTPAGIAYVPLGDALGGRPADASLLRDGVADYEAMARRDTFRAGLDRVVEGTRRFRVCLMCSEREPLDCHRCLLVARALAERNVTIGHILADGTIEPHQGTEERLLALTRTDDDLFADRPARLAEAFRRRAGTAAYRLKP